MRRSLLWSLALCLGCSTTGCSSTVQAIGDCDEEPCDCDPSSAECDEPGPPEPTPECPLECARPGDPAECGPPCEEACPLPSGVEPFELGTGEVCYERLPADGVVPHYEGPQGGYHLFLSIHCDDCPSEVLVETRLQLEETGEEVAYPTMNQRALTGSTVNGLIVPLPGSPWDPEDEPLPEGTRVILTATVRTLAGALLHEGEDTRVLGPQTYWDYCATHPEDPCCVELCDGL